jgi:hypothetical protein
MSGSGGRTKFNFNSICSASARCAAQLSQIRSPNSLSLQHKTAISRQTGQKSANSEISGTNAMRLDVAASQLESGVPKECGKYLLKKRIEESCITEEFNSKCMSYP